MKKIDIFKGRIGRTNFFLGLVSSFLVYIMFQVSFLEALIKINYFGPFIIFVVLGFLIAFTFSLYIRRFHDIGWSGWCLLFFLIPGIGFIFLLILLFANGEKESNKYGEPFPKDKDFWKAFLNQR